MSTIPKVVEDNIKLCYDISNDKLSPVTREVFYAKIKETGEHYMPTNYDCFVAGYRAYQLATDGREELEKELAITNKTGENVSCNQHYELADDLQKQVRTHINEDLFDWDEALTDEEMIFLEQLLLTFAPMFNKGSIGFAKTIQPHLTALQSSLKEKEKECEELKTEIKYWGENQLEWRRDNDGKAQLLRQQSRELEELKAENERLKGLIRQSQSASSPDPAPDPNQ